MLIDQTKIYVAGGKGGNGCSSLYKDLYHRKGVPDGGDGGRGGDVVVRSDTNLNTLLDYRYNQHHKAGNGSHGSSNRKYGKHGEDLVLRVPVGTLVKDADTDMIVRDLNKPGQSVIVARGGEGGKGNAKLREATPGEEGESLTLVLELKLVADAGVIGFPNAGKSTLVSSVTKAHTKIASYPFTTKSPKLGVVKFGDNTFVMADMPGLIEGAHEGKGLGDRFLRHIERTNVLVHMVDIMPFDGSDPAENYRAIEKELKLYGAGVYGKPRVVAANKMDLPGSREALEELKRKLAVEVIPISAATGKGVEELIKEIYQKVEHVKKSAEKDNGQDRDQGPDGQK
ncbi:MAG: GTPase ObgE [Candidatus Omnitrophica bacterium]|nr:GTPase ObgE [Candidatus Omnitrophota bacterium]